jgi:hypothetical protein
LALDAVAMPSGISARLAQLLEQRYLRDGLPSGRRRVPAPGLLLDTLLERLTAGRRHSFAALVEPPRPLRRDQPPARLDQRRQRRFRVGGDGAVGPGS